jgi:hypothetical protein
MASAVSPVCTPFPCYQENCIFAEYSEDCNNLDMKQVYIHAFLSLENSVYIQNFVLYVCFPLKFLEVENQYKTHNYF